MYKFYPSRIPVIGSEEYISLGLNATSYSEGGLGRTGVVQGGYQILGLVLTLGVALVGGVIAGLVMRIPFLKNIREPDEMFEDEPYWIIEDQEHNKENETLTKV